MKELDLNKVVVELVKQFSEPVIKGLSQLGKESFDKAKVHFDDCFANYLERNYDKHSKSKTLLYRDAPVKLKDFYVRTDLLSSENSTVKEDTFIDNLLVQNKVIVQGSAGSGKSTFCKSVFLDLIEKPSGVLPLFIELRHLNSSSSTSLYDYVLGNLSDIESRFSNTQLDYSLKLGKVLLILDGFDELDINLRNDYEKQIIGLTDKYHNIKILISTRYDSRFNSWQEFYSYTVLPLDKEKSKNLISKLNYDRQVKSKFLISLENELYEKHQSFASNPLLLTMMLLTYEQIAEIPNKIHLFYEQAFLTLFNKHDSLKNLYKRKSYTNLALDQFKRVMASFSIISYSENKYYFEHEAIIPLLEKSLRLVDVKVDPVSYLKDLIENVCILQRDGTGYTFTHRSFQEYFSAIFLVNMSNSNKFGIIDKISNLNHNDDIIYMVYDMNPDMLVKEWIIPKMEELVGRYSILPSSFDGQLEGLKMMYDGISYFDRSILDEEEGNKSKSEETTEFRSSIAYSINSGAKGNDSSFFHTLGRIYNQEYRDIYKAIAESYTSYEIERHNDLISKEIITGEDLKWDEMDSLDAETRKHIVEAGVCKVVNHRIDWLKYKIIELKKGQEAKQEDIFELLLN